MHSDKKFNPRIACYFSFTNTLAAKQLKEAVPNGQVDIYTYRSQAIHGLNPQSERLNGTYYGSFAKASADKKPEIPRLPEAFLFDLTIHSHKTYEGPSLAEKAIGRALGNGKEDMQEVATAIDMILMHQEMVDPKARKPLIFVKKSEHSNRIAKMLSNHTGLEVRVFKDDIRFQREKTDKWEKPVKHIKAMHDFRHLLKQTDKVRPTTGYEAKIKAVVGVSADNIPVPAAI
ncbi:MAG: hypothetical protein R3E13_10845 [Alphaproteobacteria bacterium]